MTVFFIAAVIAGALSALLILTRSRHVHVTGRRESNAVHELHDGEVARLGGVAIFVAGLTSLTVLSASMPDSTARLLWSLWACLSMVTVIGLYEDVRRNMPPLIRYALTAFAVMMFSLANGSLGIHSIGLPWLDPLFSNSLFATLFFVFAVTGSTHAFNLIDGQNGLSSGVAALAYGALGAVCFQIGQTQIGLFSFALAGANLGFLAFNYPFGRIFLGDCGAYLNGAAIGTIAVIVVETSGGAVSPWFALALLVYPAWDTLYSMYRRYRQGQSAFLPDVRHLHHLFYWRDRVSDSWLRYSSAPRILALASPPMLIAVIAPHNSWLLLTAVVVSVAIYSTIHRQLDTATNRSAAADPQP